MNKWKKELAKIGPSNRHLLPEHERIAITASEKDIVDFSEKVIHFTVSSNLELLNFCRSEF